MGPIWDRQDPGGPHVGHINFAIWDDNFTHLAVFLCEPKQTVDQKAAFLVISDAMTLIRVHCNAIIYYENFEADLFSSWRT